MTWGVFFDQSLVLVFKFLLSVFPLLKSAAQLIIITNSIKSGMHQVDYKQNYSIWEVIKFIWNAEKLNWVAEKILWTEEKLNNQFLILDKDKL